MSTLSVSFFEFPVEYSPYMKNLEQVAGKKIEIEFEIY